MSKKINKNILHQILEQSVENYPEEACGLCCGSEESPGVFENIYPCENIQNQLHEKNPEKHPRTARDAYNIDPERWMEVLLKAQSEGKIINMIYHSHIDCEAYFSDEDKRMAAPFGEASYPDILHLVVSIVKKKPSEIAAFLWSPKEGFVNVFREKF